MSPQEQGPKLKGVERWQKVARRIRVPLGFLTTALYLFELWRRQPRLSAIAWSLLLVLPGLWLRAYASGYVKKNRELTQTGPYAYTRNPLYLGSILIAAGFAVALLSWPVAAMLTAMFLIIYVPVIASEERFYLRSNFADFAAYCPARSASTFATDISPALLPGVKTEVSSGKFSLDLYLRHRRVQCIYRSRPCFISACSSSGRRWVCSCTCRTSQLRGGATRGFSRLPVSVPIPSNSLRSKFTGEKAHDIQDNFLRSCHLLSVLHAQQRCRRRPARSPLASHAPPGFQLPSGVRPFTYMVDWRVFTAGTAVIHFEAAGDREKLTANAVGFAAPRRNQPAFPRQRPVPVNLRSCQGLHLRVRQADRRGAPQNQLHTQARLRSIEIHPR